MSESEKELEILEHINLQAESVHQRDLAKIVGLSLGMTNAILRAARRQGVDYHPQGEQSQHSLCRRAPVGSSNRVAVPEPGEDVTPAGIEQITRRSFRYFKRTIKSR